MKSRGISAAVMDISRLASARGTPQSFHNGCCMETARMANPSRCNWKRLCLLVSNLPANYAVRGPVADLGGKQFVDNGSAPTRIVQVEPASTYRLNLSAARLTHSRRREWFGRFLVRHAFLVFLAVLERENRNLPE